MTDHPSTIAAQAELHHQYLLGLQLMVSAREGADVIGEWMFRLFRRQHEEKFLSSFEKLGLSGLPDAVACAQYHVLSNGIGGVPVEYMAESNNKAWVRFRYPRWMFDGPAICGIPVEASRGFLKGWYAHNGVSLNNPRLGFVCVSEDMTGQFGLCGYFKEHTHDLDEDERLTFAPNEMPPPFVAADQPQPPAGQWDDIRLAKANRNYAVEFVRNGVGELVGVLGRERAVELGQLSARLTGLQHYPKMAEGIGATDGEPIDTARFLAEMFTGMGDEARVESATDGARVEQHGLRIVRGLSGSNRDDLLACWIELWRGAVQSHRLLMDVEVIEAEGGMIWAIEKRGS